MVPKDPLKLFFDTGFQTACSSSLEVNDKVWQSLKGARLFLTGGTGFFGSWLLRLIQWANQTLKAEIEVTILSRDPKAFLQKRPEFAGLSSIQFMTGDVRFFSPPRESFTHIVHAATDASAQLNQENPLLMLDTITEGTRRVLEFARICKPQKVLLTSSGAVYGRQPPHLSHLTDDYSGCPNTLSPLSAYGEGKRLAEQLCTIYNQNYGVPAIIARCFAFAGPYLSWDIHFAIGNFMKDAVTGNVIQIRGDGTPYRSYLYGADLAFWLMKILTEGQPGRAYHVGSEEAYSIREIAEMTAKVISELKNSSPIDVQIAKSPVPNQLPERYVPSTERTRSELGLKENFSLRDAIRETYQWKKICDGI